MIKLLTNPLFSIINRWISPDNGNLLVNLLQFQRKLTSWVLPLHLLLLLHSLVEAKHSLDYSARLEGFLASSPLHLKAPTFSIVIVIPRNSTRRSLDITRFIILPGYLFSPCPRYFLPHTFFLCNQRLGMINNLLLSFFHHSSCDSHTHTFSHSTTVKFQL